MTYVITQRCCNDGACVDVCPVQCIRPRPGDPQYRSAEQLYIDPAACIECGACLDVCPVEAIYPADELPAPYAGYVNINAEHFAAHPIVDWSALQRARPGLPPGHAGLRVAVVGAGPSACYAVAELMRVPGVQVSVFDRLPTPFGLVRAGVAPDHPQTKKVAEQFTQALLNERVQCFFNVEVGRELSLAQLLQHHHAVIYAAGADDDTRLGIPGEDLPGAHSAREFVGWYNGHPDYAARSFDLAGDRAVIVGNGNVALDVARALALPVDVFARTDMADHALQALAHSRVSEVVVAARRGPAQAAFTTPELIALVGSQELDLLAEVRDIAATRKPSAPDSRSAADPVQARKVELVTAAAGSPRNADRRSVLLRFLLTPLSINGRERVESITFARNEIVPVGDGWTVRATGETETIATGLVLRATGYSARPVDDLPFDPARGTVPNVLGRVTQLDGAAAVPGMYCAGWIKRGASGVIGTNKLCSAETVSTLLADFAAGRLRTPEHDPAQLRELIAIRCPQRVDMQAWLRIDQQEHSRGAAAGKPRRKFVDVNAMLAAARG